MAYFEEYGTIDEKARMEDGFALLRALTSDLRAAKTNKDQRDSRWTTS